MAGLDLKGKLAVWMNAAASPGGGRFARIPQNAGVNGAVSAGALGAVGFAAAPTNTAALDALAKAQEALTQAQAAVAAAQTAARGNDGGFGGRGGGRGGAGPADDRPGHRPRRADADSL